MKILVDSKIKHLFYTVALIFFSFLLLSFFLFTLDITQTAGISLILFLMTGIAVVGVMFLYFNDQYKTMETRFPRSRTTRRAIRQPGLNATRKAN